MPSVARTGRAGVFPLLRRPPPVLLSKLTRAGGLQVVARSVETTKPAVKHDPMTNRGPSLFQKVTGFMGAGRAPAGPAAETPRVAEPAAPAMTKPVIAQIQPTLGGLDSKDRGKPGREEDDLQIPAFLRRQAN